MSQRGSPLVTFLIVLLFLVGISDAFLWGVVCHYSFCSTYRESNEGLTQGAANTGETDSNREKKEALISYLREMSEIDTLEAEMLKSYASVTGTNYTDDDAMYTEISEHTLRLCRQWEEKIVAIVPGDPEISEVHAIYRDHSTNFMNALNMIASALANQDTAQVTEANNLINETNDLKVSYQQAVRKLAEERGVSLSS